jgi:hypothetical protein
LKTLIFGVRSERLSTVGAEQLALDLAEGNDEVQRSPVEGNATADPQTGKKQRKKGRAPAVLCVLRTIRPKYGCRACESAVVQSPAPVRLIGGRQSS